MGFYGNISNTSKTNFSFDLIYNSRVQMEEAMETDGVFLGRYVLIQYDSPPIQAYYDLEHGQMYSAPTFNESTRIKNPVKGQLYQDLGNMNSVYGFYYYNGSYYEGIQTVDEISTPYAFYFRKDVSAYGRGYDATVWMKQFDPNNNKYKYVMTAELNAVVPTFHLILDPPTAGPVAPFFDRDTTNIDYYLHQQPPYGVRIAVATDENLSDEKIRRKKITWKIDPSTGMQTWDEVDESDVKGDIYYNKAGFDPNVRHESNAQNQLNYNYVKSGRVYGGDPDGTVYDKNAEAEDTYEWFIRLPAIGNSICRMWDKLYGAPANGQKRYINASQQANDTLAHLVTYDKTTMMGILNTVRDTLGYYFIPKASAPGEKIYNATTTVSYTPPAQNEINWSASTYKALDCLYYELDSNGAVSKYYYYAFTPSYTRVTASTLNNSTTYYVKDGTTYRLANKGVWKAKDANNVDIPAQTFYTRADTWTLTELEHGPEDGIYAILANIHTLLGTNAEDERSLTTVNGIVNILKDLLGSINLDLKPGRLLHTNVSTGQIEVTDTYFPGSDDDTTRVLAGNGNWVNRFNSMTVTAGESNNVTNLTVPTDPQVLDASNEHTNNFDITTGNKWIRIAGNPSNNTATFAHLVQQSIPNTTATLINHNDGTEEFSTQVVTWDEAGHIRSVVTTPHQLPMSYKTISVGENVTDTTPLTNENSVVADTTLDELQLAPGNKWVNIAAYDAEQGGIDTIKFSHTLSGVTKGSYGLAVDEDIDKLNTDNKFEIPYFTVDEAGHITKASTETITIPENFENIKLEVAADNAVGELTAKADSFKPATLTDTFTLATTNKWIRANADKANRKISLAHRLTSVENKTETGINQNNSDTFNTYDFEFDPAGHVTAKTTTTITIPNAYKTFAVGAVSTAVTDSAGHAAGNCTPDMIKDTLSFYSGNKWIRIAANRAGANSTVDDAITFGHSVYHTAPQTSVDDAVTPAFGATFAVPHFTIDEAGHVNNIASHTVKIPLPSLTDDSTGNVVTSVTLDRAAGAITIGRSNIGNLVLTGYTPIVTDPPEKNVRASDSLNAAIKKLEQQVIDEASARSSADNTLTTNLNAEIENREKAIEKEIKDRDAAIKVETDARKQAITDEKNARTTAINTAISTEATNRDNAITSAINGLVNGAPEALDTLKELSDTLAKGDNDLSATIINLNTAVNTHINNTSNPHNVTADQLGLGAEALNNMITSAVESALGNFTISLAEPKAEVVTVPVSGTDLTSVTVNVTKFADTTTIRWEKQLESGEFVAVEPTPVDPYTIEATTAEATGVYQYFLIREYMGRIQEFKSKETYTLVYTEPTPEGG